MPSPIWISNSSGYFSISIIARSIELTTASIFKSLTNSQFYTFDNVHIFFKYLVISLLLYAFLNGPLYLSKLVILQFGYMGDQVQFIEKLDTFFSLYFNLNVFCMTLYRFFDPGFEALFLMNLKHTDSINKTRNCENYLQLPDPSVVYPDYYTIRHLLKFSREFKSFTRRYANYYLLNLVIFSCIYLFPSKISFTILLFISFQTFMSKIGTMFAILSVALLQMMDYRYTAVILIVYYGSCNLAEDLLIPYFERLQFTLVEQKQWINTRKGVLFGIGLSYFIAIQRFPLISMIIYSNAFFNMGYIITKITSQIPNNTKELATWTITESVWDGQKRLINRRG